VKKHFRKWPLGRPRRRWEANIKMDLRDIGCEDGTGSGYVQW
jgi:hypothetical protein